MSNYKLPLRMCVACRQMFPKGDMIRITRLPAGNIAIDKTGKAAGRGAYVCRKPECLAKCEKAKLFNKAYHASVPNDVYEELKDSNE